MKIRILLFSSLLILGTSSTTLADSMPNPLVKCSMRLSEEVTPKSGSNLERAAVIGAGVGVLYISQPTLSTSCSITSSADITYSDEESIRAERLDFLKLRREFLLEQIAQGGGLSVRYMGLMLGCTNRLKEFEKEAKANYDWLAQAGPTAEELLERLLELTHGPKLDGFCHQKKGGAEYHRKG